MLNAEWSEALQRIATFRIPNSAFRIFDYTVRISLDFNSVRSSIFLMYLSVSF